MLKLLAGFIAFQLSLVVVFGYLKDRKDIEIRKPLTCFTILSGILVVLFSGLYVVLGY